MRIQYRYPFLYKLLIPILHKPALISEFKKTIGKNNKVLELAAGFGQMASYIDNSNSYRGIDLNKKFVEFGKKNGLDLKVGNVFDKKQYEKSDILILVDVIHHMPSNKLSKLFDLIFTHTQKKVIILEPTSANLESIFGVIGRLVDNFVKWLDYDGINKIEKWFTDEEYDILFKNRFESKFGKKFNLKIKKIFPYYLVVYTRR